MTTQDIHSKHFANLLPPLLGEAESYLGVKEAARLQCVSSQFKEPLCLQGAFRHRVRKLSNEACEKVKETNPKGLELVQRLPVLLTLFQNHVHEFNLIGVQVTQELLQELNHRFPQIMHLRLSDPVVSSGLILELRKFEKLVRISYENEECCRGFRLNWIRGCILSTKLLTEPDARSEVDSVSFCDQVQRSHCGIRQREPKRDPKQVTRFNFELDLKNDVESLEQLFAKLRVK